MPWFFLKLFLQNTFSVLPGLLLKLQDSHQQFLLAGYFIYTQALLIIEQEQKTLIVHTVAG